MTDAKEPELHVPATQTPEEKYSQNEEISVRQLKNHKWFLRVAVYTLLVLLGQTSATLLGRVYYNKGGKSIWLSALRQTIAFPILIPFSLYFSPPYSANHHPNPPSFLKLAVIYISLGIFQALDGLLYSIGLLYLPVSTYSLISASQLAFNVLFSFFLNAQKLTPPIINSVVLLTISSTLLALQTGSENTKNNSSKTYVTGIICTVFASAIFSLLLSLTQVFFQKVLRKQNLRAALNTIIYQSSVATCISVVALFVSKDGKTLKKEMEEFESGKVLYIIISVGIAVAWQVFSMGAVALVYEVSSLFSNVIGTLGMPIVPVLAVLFFHDKMSGIKVISLILAVWGFSSYVYEQYLSKSQSKTETENVSQVPELSTTYLIWGTTGISL